MGRKAIKKEDQRTIVINVRLNELEHKAVLTYMKKHEINTISPLLRDSTLKAIGYIKKTKKKASEADLLPAGEQSKEE